MHALAASGTEAVGAHPLYTLTFAAATFTGSRPHLLHCSMSNVVGEQPASRIKP